MAKKAKTIIGWEEWCSFPELGIPAIKAKVDTGAKTSCLHAFNLKIVTIDDKKYISFSIHPIQKSKIIVKCMAEMVDYRYVTNSGGYREQRYVIKTLMNMGENSWPVEVTLAKRHKMAFRMLLGREAMRKGKLAVDPSKSCLLGKMGKDAVAALYNGK